MVCPDLSVFPVGVIAYTDGVLVARRELTADDFTVIHHLREPLRDKESLSVYLKRSPILSNAPPPMVEYVLLAGVGASIANADEVVLVGVQLGSEPFVKRHGLEVVCKRGVERYARLLSHMPDKQAVMLIATRAETYKITSYQRGLCTRLLGAAFKRVDRECLWNIWRVLTLATSRTEELFVFMKVCTVHRLSFDLQHTKFCSSTAAEDLGLTLLLLLFISH